MKLKRIFYTVIICSGILISIIGCDSPPPPDPQSNPQDPTPSVKICNQTWMLKNLDTDKYRNGDPIPQVTDRTAWANLKTGAWCYFQNDPANGAVYGKLYNWYAVNDPRGLAPAGWHIPTTNEYSTLANCLGGGLVAGDKLKASGTTLWGLGNTTATNSSGFTALPGGFRLGLADGWNNGVFSGYNEGRWWTRTPYDSDWSWFHNLLGSASNSYIDYSNKDMGFSVRCVKD